MHHHRGTEEGPAVGVKGARGRGGNSLSPEGHVDVVHLYSKGNSNPLQSDLL